MAGPRGPERGTIAVDAWGADHCKVTIELGIPGARRTYTATTVGKRTLTTGPAGVGQRVPLPAGPAAGCALLPGGVGRSFDERGRNVSVGYEGSTVRVLVDGEARLTAVFGPVEARGFADSDFALPPPPRLPAKRTLGGGTSGGGR